MSIDFLVGEQWNAAKYPALMPILMGVATPPQLIIIS